MTFAAVGSLIQGSGPSIGSGTSFTFTLVPGAVGDLIMLVPTIRSNAVWPTSMSSSNVTWTLFGSKFTGTADPGFQWSMATFAGKVTSTSSATVTVNLNGNDPGRSLFDGQEFSATSRQWAFDSQANLDQANPGILTFPSITPAFGLGELYWAYGIFPNTGASSGSTTGYTFVPDSDTNGACYNPACTSSAQAPVWGGNATNNGCVLAQATMVRELPGPRSYLSQNSGMF